MKVLVVQPPIVLAADFIDYPHFTALAAWQMAAFLDAAGYETKLLDALSMHSAACRIQENGGYRLGADTDALCGEIERTAFDAALVHLDSFRVEVGDFKDISAILQSLKNRNETAKTILADMHIGGMNYHRYDAKALIAKLSCPPDFLIRYEAEQAIAQLLAAIQAGSAERFPRVIHGQAAGKETIAQTGGSYKLANLESYEHFLARFAQCVGRVDSFGIFEGALPMKASRGCPFHCSFCTSHPGRPDGILSAWRPVGLAHIEAELETIRAKSEIRKIVLLDEAANADAARFDDLLALFEPKGFKLEIPNGLRADRLTEQTIARMAKLCTLLSLSPEMGGDDAIRRHIGKGQSLETVEDAAKLAKKHGLPLALHFMIGLPNETKKETHETIQFAKRMFDEWGAVPWVQFAVAMEGTKLFDKAKALDLLADEHFTSEGFQKRPSLKEGASELGGEALSKLKTALDAYVAKHIEKERHAPR